MLEGCLTVLVFTIIGVCMLREIPIDLSSMQASYECYGIVLNGKPDPKVTHPDPIKGNTTFELLKVRDIFDILCPFNVLHHITNTL